MKKGLFAVLFLVYSYFLIAQNNPILAILKKDNSLLIKDLVDNPKKYKLKICYSNQHNTFQYRTNIQEYFFPASTAKLIFALCAAEVLSAHQIPLSAKFCYRRDSSKALTDSVFWNNSPTIASVFYKALTVSDNKAANLLYDIANLDFIQWRMKEWNMIQSIVSQRFSRVETLKNRIHPAILFLDTAKQNIATLDSVVVPAYCTKYNKINCLVGKYHEENGRKIKKPYNFVLDNYVDLGEIHHLLIQLMADSTNKVIKLNSEYKHLIVNSLGLYPSECTNVNFKKEEGYYDHCRKYLLLGTEDTPKDSCLRIYNKVGLAYGFLTDVAFIKNDCDSVSFFLSVSLYVNADNVVNDGKYDYEKGMKMMKRIGELFYEEEKNKHK